MHIYSEISTTRDLFGWTVILKQQGHQNAHIHPSGWLSGVIYIKVVPSLGKDEGAIEFSLNSRHYYDVNSPSLTFQPKEGDMVFFPSSASPQNYSFHNRCGQDYCFVRFSTKCSSKRA